jgi:hypothetical protein
MFRPRFGQADPLDSNWREAVHEVKQVQLASGIGAVWVLCQGHTLYILCVTSL